MDPTASKTGTITSYDEQTGKAIITPDDGSNPLPFDQYDIPHVFVKNIVGSWGDSFQRQVVKVGMKVSFKAKASLVMVQPEEEAKVKSKL